MNQLIFWLFLQHPSRFAFILFYTATGLLAGSILVLVLSLLFLGNTTAKIILLVVFLISLLAGIIQALTRRSEQQNEL
jgi:protein-S-isoprenylcysteine O-methyltransferase Ste14